MNRASILLAAILVAATIAGCSLARGTLGGRQKCWDASDARIPSLFKGWIDLDTQLPTFNTTEGDRFHLMFGALAMKNSPAGLILVDQAGTTVAADGDLVTVFGGLGSDSSFMLCDIEEHNT